MILERGNMWNVFGKGIFMITTNPIIRKDGAVVMGRGIALEAKIRYPKLPYDFASAIKNMSNEIDWVNVGPIGVYDNTEIWHFMVKNHWRDEASLSIIEQSVSDLIYIWKPKFESIRVDLNFPGIGNGGLNREDVLPIIEVLPDNVHIWEYAS